MIQLHNSAQAFMVLALKGTANFNVIKKPEKLFDAIQNGKDGKDYPREYLLNFIKLYKDINYQKKMKQNVDSRIYAGSNEADYAMKKIKLRATTPP